MTRNRIIFLIVFLFTCSSVAAQDLIFRQPDPASDSYRMKVRKNDKVLVADDSAYIYSTAMVLKIRDLENRYMICLADRENDLQQVKILLASLQDGYSGINDLLTKSSVLNSEQLVLYQKQVEEIIKNLETDISSLHQLDNLVLNAREELDSIKKEVRKEKNRIWWKKTGSIFAALIAGFAAGFLIGAT
jgi:hypothetical protein